MRQAPGTLHGNFTDRYVIERELGRGATAVVYLARDREMSRLVAIKILRAELVSEISTERFLREIQRTSELSHPNILPVLASGEHEKLPYCVFPYMDEGTLRTRLDREKQLPLPDVVALGSRVARALAFAHSRKLIHRDVKPENILFTAGQPVLADFGIARAVERALGDSTTSTGIVRGTPAYMSPEQAGAAQELDGRTDIYSLACVLYEAAAGVPAFIGATPQQLASQRLVHMPRPLSVYRPSVPESLERVLTRALALTPADRYRNAEEFAEALESIDPSTLNATGGTRRFAARLRARRSFLIVATVAAVAAIATAAALAARKGHAVSDIPDGDPRRIAVLYFDNLTPATVPQYVVDGVTEELIDRLAAVRALRVITPAAVRKYRAPAVPLDSVARSLNVGTIIGGSIAQSGQKLRVTVRVTDTTKKQLYSTTVAIPKADLFELQDSLGDKVEVYLRQTVGDIVANRAQRATTRSSLAWALAQEASDLTHRAVEGGILRNDPNSGAMQLRADSLYARAAEADPHWSLPLVKRGRLALAELTATGPPDRKDSVAYWQRTPAERRVIWAQRAVQLAEDALRIDKGSAEALALRGSARNMMLAFGAKPSDSIAALAERDVRAALDQRPDYANAWSVLAQLASRDGRYGEAATAAEEASRADPFFEVPNITSTAFWATLRSERYADARRWCQLGQSRYPGDPRFTECRLTLLGWTGQTRADADSAWRILRTIEETDSRRMLDDTWRYRRLMVAAILARAGLRDSARQITALVPAGNSPEPYGPARLEEANVRLLVGERDRALALLAEQLRITPQARAQIAGNPMFKSLHGDPRFDGIVAKPR